MTRVTVLHLSWGVSRGRDTYGYNIRRLDDTDTRKRYRCNGGGYDMTGTVLADWLIDRYADRIMAAVRSGELIPYATLTDGADSSGPLTRTYADDSAGQGLGGSRGAYGLTVLAYGDHAADPRPSIDGACGVESVRRIMESIGLDVRGVLGSTRATRGEYVEYLVTDTRADVPA